MNEVERIQAAYRRRDAANRQLLYSPFNPAALFMEQQRERRVLALLRRSGLCPLEGLSVLDVGCGTGRWLRRLLDYGLAPENLHGVDLLPDRIAQAQRLSPNLNFRLGNGERLPYADASFDLVSQFVVFTSILAPDMRRNVASEMLRTLKPGGAILWYDYHINNPRNPDVRAVKKEEIYRLFPRCAIRLEQITLAPPITRKVAPLTWLAALMLEKAPFLRTHYLGLFTKLGNQPGAVN